MRWLYREKRTLTQVQRHRQTHRCAYANCILFPPLTVLTISPRAECPADDIDRVQAYTITGRRQKGVTIRVETRRSFLKLVVVKNHIYVRMPRRLAIDWKRAIRPRSSGPNLSSFVIK